MLTTAITAMIAAFLAQMGFEPTPARLAALWITVKVVVVMGILGGTARFMKPKAEVPPPIAEAGPGVEPTAPAPEEGR